MLAVGNVNREPVGRRMRMCELVCFDASMAFLSFASFRSSARPSFRSFRGCDGDCDPGEMQDSDEGGGVDEDVGDFEDGEFRGGGKGVFCGGKTKALFFCRVARNRSECCVFVGCGSGNGTGSSCDEDAWGGNGRGCGGDGCGVDGDGCGVDGRGGDG